MTKQEDINTSSTKVYQRQTISNLFNSDIPIESIALQLDMDVKEVKKIIEEIRKEEDEKLQRQSTIHTTLGLKAASYLDQFNLDSIVNIDLAILRAQNSIWEALKSELVFDISMEEIGVAITIAL